MNPLDQKLSKIKLLLLDVDGVLTSGQVIYNDDGSQTMIFNVKDGLGIRLLQKAGINTGIITGRSSQALLHRCQNLGLDTVLHGVRNKLAALNGILQQTGLQAEQVAFIGDDLPDLPLFGTVGVAVAVADAHPIIRQAADMITRAPGGKGAVRQVCEAILKARGDYDSLVNDLFGSGSLP